jgi:hypothetical protein
MSSAFLNVPFRVIFIVGSNRNLEGISQVTRDVMAGLEWIPLQKLKIINAVWVHAFL